GCGAGERPRDVLAPKPLDRRDRLAAGGVTGDGDAEQRQVSAVVDLDSGPPEGRVLSQLGLQPRDRLLYLGPVHVAVDDDLGRRNETEGEVLLKDEEPLDRKSVVEGK